MSFASKLPDINILGTTITYRPEDSKVLSEVFKVLCFINDHSTIVGCRSVTTKRIVVGSSETDVFCRPLVYTQIEVVGDSTRVTNIFNSDYGSALDHLDGLITAAKTIDFLNTTIVEKLSVLGVYTFGYNPPTDEHWYKGVYPTDAEITAIWEKYTE